MLIEIKVKYNANLFLALIYMKLTTTPECPKYFKLNKNNCKCTIKKNYLDKLVKSEKNKKTKKAKKDKQRLPRVNINPQIGDRRCPKGMYYDKRYQMCELDALNTKELNKTKRTKKNNKQNKKFKRRKSPISTDSLSISIDTTPNIKPKTRKNNKTGKKTKVIKNNTPPINRILGRFYNNEVNKDEKPKPLTKKKALANLDRIVSFSPEVNRQLVSMKTIARNTVDDCDTFSGNVPRIRLKNGKCVSYNNPEAQDYLLTNLSSKSKTNCNEVIAPKQFASNCWFNTMFMSFFISDKGKKFFRFFRQLMIKGVNSRGVPIAKNLHMALFKLNMAIEAVLGSQSSSDNAVARKMALDMNTNIIIQKIYNAIPPAYRHGVYAKNKAGNPLSYYEAIIRYLGDNSVDILTIGTSSNERHHGKDWEKSIYADMEHRRGQLPDIIIMEFIDERDHPNQAFEPSRKSNKPLAFSIKGRGDTAQYTLDSCIVRDVHKHHFASTLTCSKKQFGFDGISFGGLNPFAWKKLINVNKNWTFEGSDTEWNFRDSYQILFYYRN